jgi:hypothetical protein
LTPAVAAAGPKKAALPDPAAQWSFDESGGSTARESVSGRRDQIDYVFNDAKYKPDSDPTRRPGISKNALFFDAGAGRV